MIFLKTSVKNRQLLKYVLWPVFILGCVWLGETVIGAVLCAMFTSQTILNHVLSNQRSMWLSLAKFIMMVLLISCLAGVFFFLIILQIEFIGELAKDPISYANLGKLLVWSMIGMLAWTIYAYQRSQGESRKFMKATTVVSTAILLFFYFGNLNRFGESSFPLDDLSDLIYIFLTTLVYWYLWMGWTKRIHAFEKKMDQVVFKVFRFLGFVLPFVLLDYLGLSFYLNEMYQTSIYTDYWVMELPLKILLIAGINYWPEAVATEEEEMVTLQARIGKTHRLLKADQILFFLVQHQNTYAITRAEEKAVMNETLTDLEDCLPASNFFRLNRQLITTREAIVGFEPIENRKLKVKLQQIGDLSEYHEVSRLKAADFRQWIAGE